MTVVVGTVADASGRLLDGVMWVQVPVFRTDGSVTFAPERTPYLIDAGQVSADLHPGPARLTIDVGAASRTPHTVTIPDTGPVTLASLIGDS